MLRSHWQGCPRDLAVQVQYSEFFSVHVLLYIFIYFIYIMFAVVCRLRAWWNLLLYILYEMQKHTYVMLIERSYLVVL